MRSPTGMPPCRCSCCSCCCSNGGRLPPLHFEHPAGKLRQPGWRCSGALPHAGEAGLQRQRCQWDAQCLPLQVQRWQLNLPHTVPGCSPPPTRAPQPLVLALLPPLALLYRRLQVRGAAEWHGLLLEAGAGKRGVVVWRVPVSGGGRCCARCCSLPCPRLHPSPPPPPPLQQYYRATSRELRRLEAVAKSPVYTAFSGWCRESRHPSNGGGSVGSAAPAVWPPPLPAC